MRAGETRATLSLDGWREVSDKSAIKPFVTENLGSELVVGFISPTGSYVFVTRTKHGLDRDALSTDDLDSMLGGSVFDRWKPTDFSKTVRELETAGQQRIPVLYLHVAALGSGYDFSSGKSTPTTRVTVYVPFPWREHGSLRYHNELYALHFRGPSSARGDIAAFESFWRRFPGPAALDDTSAEYVSPEQFNAFRPQLTSTAVDAGSPPDPVAPSRSNNVRGSISSVNSQSASGGLHAVLTSVLLGSGEKQQVEMIEKSARRNPDSVLATVLGSIAADSRRRIEQRESVEWAREYIESEAPAETRAKFLVMIFEEASSQRRGDYIGVLASCLATDAVLQRALLPDQWQRLLEAAFDQARTGPEPLKPFEQLNPLPPELHKQITLLADRHGIPVPLVDKACKKSRRRAAWRNCDKPGQFLARTGGEFVLLTPGNRRREWGPSRLANLFDVLSTLAELAGDA